mmetsp:Transcript_22579/g.37729  ORF Transcript_22579/g.37729 Transcript_22579/m.37729 type:complete len:377 (-) Transcript_22579:454-1584(-)
MLTAKNSLACECGKLINMAVTVHKAMVRPLMEHAAAVWSPSLPAHSLRLLEGVQSEAMRWALRAPVRVPAVAIRLELGLPSMASRLQTLTMRFFLKSASFTKRLCSSLWGSCFQLDLLPARSIKRLILSVLQSAPPNLLASNSLTEWVAAWNSQTSSIASRDARLVRAQVSRMHSLRHLLEVRSWEPISKLQSWSQGEVGKPAHLHCSKCLDEWNDARGVSLKFQARCGALWWRHNTARFFALEQHEGWCSSCDSHEDVSLMHLLFSCQGTCDIRDRFWTRIRHLVSRHQPDANDDVVTLRAFSAMSSHDKFCLALGATSGVPSTDKEIDRAFRRTIVLLDTFAAVRHPRCQLQFQPIHISTTPLIGIHANFRGCG